MVLDTDYICLQRLERRRALTCVVSTHIFVECHVFIQDGSMVGTEKSLQELESGLSG